jgi:hypothetical protein
MPAKKSNYESRGQINYMGGKPFRIAGAARSSSAGKLSGVILMDERQISEKEMTDAVLTAHENERTDIFFS